MNEAMQSFIAGLARQAGALLLGYFRSATLRRDIKGEGAWDLVTEADHAAERAIIAAVRARFPDHDVFGEESGRSGLTSRSLWLIDPLDGTLNFSRGLPTWGVSVGLAEDGEVRYGAFYDPLHDELFYAEKGQGATLNGAPLRASGLADPHDAVVYCSVAHGEQEELARRNVRLLWGHVMRLRMTGSVGSALAAVAAGRMDAAIELRGGPWDYAAGGLLVREAGGHTTTFDGAPLRADAHTVFAAATPALHRALYDILSNQPSAISRQP